MRKYASAEERAAKNQKTTVRHFGFTEKIYVDRACSDSAAGRAVERIWRRRFMA